MTKPKPDCPASTWSAARYGPYGSGGYHRCTLPSADGHTTHVDSFGNRFLFEDTGAILVMA